MHCDSFLLYVNVSYLTGHFLLFRPFNHSELQRAYSAAVPGDVAQDSQGFPFRVLIDVGVPYLVALNAYDSIIGTENHTLMGGVDHQRRLEHMTNLVVMLEDWVREAQATLFGARNEALDQLSNAMASGSLLSRIDSVKAQLHSLPGATADIESRLLAVEEAIKQRI